MLFVFFTVADARDAVSPNKLCLRLCLRLSVIGRLEIPPFTIFFNLKCGNLSDFCNLGN